MRPTAPCGWGCGGNGQLGLAARRLVDACGGPGPERVVRTLSCRRTVVLASRADGSVWAGVTTARASWATAHDERSTPTKVTGLPPVRALAAGRYHGWPWGSTAASGPGAANPSASSGAPDRAPGRGRPDHRGRAGRGRRRPLGRAALGRARADVGCGLAGSARRRHHGQPADQPALVPGLTGDASIGAGWLNTMAVNSAGTTRRGDNAAGQVGDNTTTRRVSPVALVGPCAARSAAGGDGDHSRPVP